MIKILIDYQEYQAKENETVLQTALRYGLTSIPSLCYHAGLKVEGSCRLCVVEVEGDGMNLTTACTLKVREGLSVATKTAAIIDSRRRTLRYLLKRAPDNNLLKKWCQEYGIDSDKEDITGFSGTQTLRDCILCGLCVRACRQLGFEALQFVGKGADRHLKQLPVSGKTSCIGCRACERLCPSQAINSEVAESNLQWKHWEDAHPMAACPQCGKEFVTQEALDFVKSKVPISRKNIQLCSTCKRLRNIDH